METEGLQSEKTLLTVYITRPSIIMRHVTPYKVKKEFIFAELTDARSLSVTLQGQAGLPDVGGLVHASCRHTTYSREEATVEKSFHVKFFLP